MEQGLPVCESLALGNRGTPRSIFTENERKDHLVTIKDLL